MNPVNVTTGPGDELIDACGKQQAAIDAQASDPRPTIRFSDIPTGKTFFGEVTSRRSGVTTRGIFLKLAHRAILVENPYDDAPTTSEELAVAPPLGRYIRPAALVLVLVTASGHLTADRVSLMIDDLEVRDLCYVGTNYKFDIPSMAVRDEMQKAAHEQRLIDLLKAFAP